MQRRGPGLLLRDIERGEDPDVAAVVDTIAHNSPDILLLTGFDWDHGLAAARALEARLDAAGAGYPYLFARRPNSGLATGLDMDGDGRTGGPRDAQGFGWYAGQGAMVLLSRLPVRAAAARDFSAVRWRDFPGALLPEVDGHPFPSETALAAQRLSTTGHWDVPVTLPDGGALHLLCFYAGPPIFDGPEDRNGRRNHDEVAFWSAYLDGALPQPAPATPVVVLGNANLDPADGEGRRAAISDLLAHARLQDPAPASAGAAEAARLDDGVNAGQSGDPARDTADWSDTDGPGNLRVSYVLPDARLSVAGAGVVWPAKDDPLRRLIEGEDLPRHRLVWVDLEVPAR
ncbi:endonuclease/exonuclease/phosphatase family protein [Psychromarinibacter sp. C21-152]|uniref:Endonuclease/exonuclease/phosphatase family protein n=1 Tax=Psychromarinibacter sediminicola TaxID=3033385 RepID=A0AAE3T8U5_9RHOB|nr:endonuclease/exonuclease/phosphatase family protein [Psychromarinibacter sediminicola]MDF0601103.1 endonuclease/exonuclease/phosphatase family protein [Psychromarinibacter sediminicola]